MDSADHDVIIAGSGLAGLTASLAFARAGYSVFTVSPNHGGSDLRTTALLNQSLEFLNRLGIGASVRRSGAPLATIRIVDATDRLLRAPQVSFHASEIGLEAFGYNVANEELARIIRKAAVQTGVIFADATVETLRDRTDRCEVGLDNGTVHNSGLVVGADGRNSTIRRLAGIGARQWRYRQSAIVLNYSHQLPHDDASTEFHTDAGPFTIVPLGPKMAGLVWVEDPVRAEAVMGLAPSELALMIERRMHSMLGRIEIGSHPQSYPLSGLVAHRLGTGRIALVGEAAHVFPPIGAQGFNLGIRDIEALAGLASGLKGGVIDPLGERYHRRRFPDVASRGAAIDLLNRSLVTDFLPVQLARRIGIGAIASIPPLRRLAMREGVGPGLQARAVVDSLSRLFGNLSDRTRSP